MFVLSRIQRPRASRILAQGNALGKKVKDRLQAEGLIHMGGTSLGRMMGQPFRLREIIGLGTQGVALG